MIQEPIDRRTLITLAAVALTGCASDTPSSTASSTPSGTSSSTPSSTASGGPSGTPTSPTKPTASRPPDWTGFARNLDGKLYRPGNTGYAASHRLFDPRYDSVQPAGVVQAASVDDVREAVLFARSNNLVCVAKSGGHSYVGASAVTNGLMIDVGGLRGISYAGGQVTVGSGAKLYDVHQAIDRYGRSLPTGTCPTVGIAGLALGGGLGVHTPTYGLTSDRIVSLDVVTADGELRKVDATHEAELYWALRGGGGGNFGIVTSFRLSTVPGGRTGHFTLRWPESRAAAVVRGWQRFAREGSAAYWANLHLDARTEGSLAVRVVGVAITGSATAAAAQLESMVGVRAASRSFSTKSHMEAVRYLGGGSSSPRTMFTAGSDVLRGPMDAGTVTAFLGAVKSRARSGQAGSAILDPLGGQAAKGDSAWPWRSALGTIQWYAGLTGNPASYRSARNWIDAGHSAVRKASAGGYLNYLEPGRAVASYYGPNWNRLRAARRHYDPTGFFRSPFRIE